jgi:hypothetical protein
MELLKFIIAYLIGLVIGWLIADFVRNSNYVNCYVYYRESGFTVFNSIKRAYKVCK